MNIFEHFNQSTGAICPVCNSNKDAPTILVPIPGTETGGIVECKQVHKKCYDLVIEMNSDDIEPNNSVSS